MAACVRISLLNTESDFVFDTAGDKFLLRHLVVSFKQTEVSKQADKYM